MAQLAGASDILHVHGDTASVLCAPLLWRHPSVATTHGLHRLRRLERAPSRAFAAGLLAADVTVCTSAAEQAELADIVGPKASTTLVTVPNGIVTPEISDRVRAEARAELELADGDVAVLFVAELEPRKDPLLVVAATEAARRRGAPLVLLLAGAGSLGPVLKSRAGPGVRPLGFSEDVSRLYAAADVFVLPSWREGMSIALLEAMAHGLAVIASDIAGTLEAVGSTGRLVAPGDLKAWTDELSELAFDGEARLELGEAARERVVSELSLDLFLVRMRTVYEEVGGWPLRAPDPGHSEPGA